METMKCLDCGNTTKFIIPYIDRTMTTFDESGDVVDEYSVGYQLNVYENIFCGECEYDNLNIYLERNK